MHGLCNDVCTPIATQHTHQMLEPRKSGLLNYVDAILEHATKKLDSPRWLRRTAPLRCKSLRNPPRMVLPRTIRDQGSVFRLICTQFRHVLSGSELLHPRLSRAGIKSNAYWPGPPCLCQMERRSSELCCCDRNAPLSPEEVVALCRCDCSDCSCSSPSTLVSSTRI